MSQHRRLRVAVVQFSPKIGHVKENIDTASRLCSKLVPQSVDLVCLPEMTLTGYVFPDAESISPYLEDPIQGPTAQFCAKLSKQLHCYVAAGYPERLAPHEKGTVTINDGADTIHQVGANSAVLYDPEGSRIGNYRKTNLFETDMTWSKPGTGFVTFNLPEPLRTLSLGICMDLNAQPPALWTIEDGPYELADYCITNKSNILLLLNAWLDSGQEEEKEKDWSTLNYWCMRLRPLWDKPEENDGPEGHGETTQDAQETIVIICNRCGEENGKTFAGTSAMFSMKRGSGRPKLLHSMERRSEGMDIWTV